MITGAFIALAAVALRHLREQAPPPPPALRLSLALPDAVQAGTADETLDAAVSPDESEIVFVATQRDGESADDARPGVARLWRRRLTDERASALAGTDGAQQPAWKTTGNAIAFFAAGRLKQVTLQDGVIHDLADAPAAFGASWLPDGSLLFAAGAGPIQRIADGKTTAVTRLADGEAAHAFPVATGRDGEFVYVAVRADGRRTVRLAAAGRTRDLTATSGHAVLIGGRLLHVRDGVLLAYAFDAATGELSPRGVPVALDVGVAASGRALFAASPKLLLHARRGSTATRIQWLDYAGQRGATIADTGDYTQVRLSPDDRQAAVTMTDPLLRGLDIAVAPTDGSLSLQRLTVALAAETDPVWAPDSRRVLFRSTEGGSANLFARQVPAREETNEVVLRSGLDATPTDWRADRILFRARQNRGFDIMTLDPASGDIEPVVESAFGESDARWSPDGRWLAFVADESGQPDVYVRRPDATRIRVSFGGGRGPRWTRDGRALLFRRGARVMRADLTAGQPPGTMFGPPQMLFEAPGLRDFDVAHRSDRILALVPAAGDVPPAIGVVVNWGSIATP